MNTLMRFLLCTGLIAGQVTMVTAAAGAGRAGRGSMDEELMSPASVATSVAISSDGTSPDGITSPSTISPTVEFKRDELGLTPREKALYDSLHSHLLTSTFPTIYDALKEWTFSVGSVFDKEEIALFNAKLASDVAIFIDFLASRSFSIKNTSLILAFWFITGRLRDDLFPCLKLLNPMDLMGYIHSEPASPRVPRVTVDPLPGATNGEVDQARRLSRPRAQSF